MANKMNAPKKSEAAASKKPILSQPLEMEYEDGSREVVVIKRLSNTDLLVWIDSGFNKPFLVFRSVERAAPEDRVHQQWLDALAPASALAVVETALRLNHSPEVQKKILDQTREMLESFHSLTLANSSSAADTKSPR